MSAEELSHLEARIEGTLRAIKDCESCSFEVTVSIPEFLREPYVRLLRRNLQDLELQAAHLRVRLERA